MFTIYKDDKTEIYVLASLTVWNSPPNSVSKHMLRVKNFYLPGIGLL